METQTGADAVLAGHEDDPAPSGHERVGPGPVDGQHFVGFLGLEIWHQDGQTRGRATLTPQMWARGTRRPRVGLLFTMADMVGGHPVTGTITPTVDLRLRLLGAAPSTGPILMEVNPIKVGRRLWTGEVVFRGEGSGEVFAVSEFTFLNQKMADIAGGEPDSEAMSGRRPGRPPVPLPATSFDEMFRMRFPTAAAVEMDPHEAVRNGVYGTIQGGAQAMMAEVAAERALSGRGDFAVADIHVRYLNPVKVGPAIARAEVLAGDDLRPVVRVAITDEGAGGRIVSTALTVCRPGG